MTEHYNIPPDPSLYAAIREMGYSPETAIADIIDNSIAANAKNVKIEIKWNNTKSFITITDDGCGMDKETLLNAMKLAGSYFKQDRKPSDLGRYGLGLKSAAGALGSHLTVITNNGTEINDASWDINKICMNLLKNNWGVDVNVDDDDIIQEYRNQIGDKESGTIILIRNLDKFTTGKDSDENKKIFYKNINKIEKHLELVFHRYIYEDGLNIQINNNDSLEPWDPFLTNWPEKSAAYQAVEELDEKVISGPNGKVKIQSYVLPHKSKFDSQDKDKYSYKNAGGPYGWHANQGFYLYRNKRLIMHGDWFGLIEKAKFFDLARIKIDILPSHDAEWHISVDKTKAIPPSDVRKGLKQIAEKCTKRSMEVYNSRASSSRGLMRPSLAAAWEQRKSEAGVYSYHLNKKHPLYISLKQSMSPEQEEMFHSYIAVIENYSPVMQMGLGNIGNMEISTNTVNECLVEKDKYDIQKLIKGFIKTKCDYAEIKQTILEMPKYSYLKKDFDTIYKEATND